MPIRCGHVRYATFVFEINKLLIQGSICLNLIFQEASDRNQYFRNDSLSSIGCTHANAFVNVYHKGNRSYALGSTRTFNDKL